MNTVTTIRTFLMKAAFAAVVASITLIWSCSKKKDSDDERSFVIIKLNGKEYRYDAEATVSSGGEVNMEFSRTVQPNPIEFFGGLSWKDGEGTHVWSDDTDFWWEPEGMSPTRVYQHLYDDGTKISAGSIIVTSIEPVGGFITGRFTIEQSGATNTESGNGEYIGASKVEGTFRVERVD